MARVTVEDCLKVIPNRFVLALVAAKRTRQLLSGARATISKTDNKPCVVSLREIEENKVHAREVGVGDITISANGSTPHN